jgi:hypothetical protein
MAYPIYDHHEKIIDTDTFMKIKKVDKISEEEFIITTFRAINEKVFTKIKFVNNVHIDEDEMTSNMSSAQEIEAFKQEWKSKWRPSIGTGSQGTSVKEEKKHTQSAKPTTSHPSPPARPSPSNPEGSTSLGQDGTIVHRKHSGWKYWVKFEDEQDDLSTGFSSGRLTKALKTTPQALASSARCRWP